MRSAVSTIETCEGAVGGSGQWGTAGDSSFLMYDTGRRTYKGAIVALPGLNLTAATWSPLVAGTAYEHVRALVRAGYVVLAIDGGSLTLWPSPALNTIVDAAVTAVLARFGGSKVGLLGFSRGGDSSLDYLLHYPSRVAGAYMFSASPDLSWAYAPAGYAPPYGVSPSHATYSPEIDTSFSCDSSTYAAATVGYRMMDSAADFRGLCPIKMVHATGDAAVPVALVQAFVAAVNDPRVTLHETAAGGHGNFTQIDPAETVGFFNYAMAAA